LATLENPKESACGQVLTLGNPEKNSAARFRRLEIQKKRLRPGVDAWQPEQKSPAAGL